MKRIFQFVLWACLTVCPFFLQGQKVDSVRVVDPRTFPNDTTIVDTDETYGRPTGSNKRYQMKYIRKYVRQGFSGVISVDAISGAVTFANDGLAWSKLTQAVRDSIITGKKKVRLTSTAPGASYLADIVVDTVGLDTIYIWNTSGYRRFIAGGGNSEHTGIYAGSDSLTQENTYAAMAADGSQNFGLGYFPIFPDYGSSNGSYGLFMSPGTYDQIGLINTQGYYKGFSVGSSSIVANIFNGNRQSTVNQSLGKYSVRVSGSINTDKYWQVIIDSLKFEITRNISGTNRTYQLLPPSQYPSTTSGITNILKWTGDGSNAVPGFGLVPNIYNEDGTISSSRTILLPNSDFIRIKGTPNSKQFRGYLGVDDYPSNNIEWDWQSYKSGTTYSNIFSSYGGEYDGNDFYWNINNETTKSATNNYSHQSFDVSRFSGGVINQTGLINYTDSLLNSYLGALFLKTTGSVIYNSGFISGLSSYGNANAYSITPIWAVQRKVSSSYFNYIKINIGDTTSHSVLPYGKYALVNATPSATSGAISTHIWVAGTPSFLRSQHGVATGTTDGSGDLTVTFAAEMPDATFTAIAQDEGTTGNYTWKVHTKTTSGFKIRVTNATTGAAVTSTAVTFGYDAKDY
jgi:hypothetical protein